MTHKINFRDSWSCSLVAIALLVSGRAVLASDVEISSRAFAEHRAEGTFVAFDPVEGRSFVLDRRRSEERFVPASTFKIVNTLIGLTCGAVATVDVILPYGGKLQPYPHWEQDMSLRSAMPISNVPIYQELARRIGLEAMQRMVKAFRYGNEEVGNVVDRFWLDGPLRISAVEQVHFLRRMLEGKLGVPDQEINAVREITRLESTPDYELHGKTGWGPVDEIGWFIGWVTKDGKDYPFALNMLISDQDALPLRIEITKQCLREVGILPKDLTE